MALAYLSGLYSFAKLENGMPIAQFGAKTARRMRERAPPHTRSPRPTHAGQSHGANTPGRATRILICGHRSNRLHFDISHAKHRQTITYGLMLSKNQP